MFVNLPTGSSLSSDCYMPCGVFCNLVFIPSIKTNQLDIVIFTKKNYICTRLQVFIQVQAFQVNQRNY